MSMVGIVLRNRLLAWRSNQPFFLVVFAYSLLAFVAARHWKIPIDFQLYSEPFLLFGSGVTVLLFAIISTRVMFQRPDRLLPALRNRLLTNDVPNRLVVGLPVALVLPLFFSLFTSVKDQMSRIVPFYADPEIMRIDRMVHGGLDSWQVFHPFIGYGIAIFAMNFTYNLWFIVMFIILFCNVFSKRDYIVRSQYLVTFILVWAVLGNLAATIFSSVGPAFVNAFYGDTTFSPLMSYLQVTNATYPVWALTTQRMLLSTVAAGGPKLGSGISAFPSLHVAVATLNAIYLWRFRGLLRWAGVAFLILIQMGSVQLAWHYGVDGYASMLATPIIWMFSGWFSRVQLR